MAIGLMQPGGETVLVTTRPVTSVYMTDGSDCTRRRQWDVSSSSYLRRSPPRIDPLPFGTMQFCVNPSIARCGRAPVISLGHPLRNVARTGDSLSQAASYMHLVTNDQRTCTNSRREVYATSLRRRPR